MCTLLCFLDRTVFCPFGDLLLWYYEFVLMLSSDIHRNPGSLDDRIKGINSGFLTFCNWNLNTLSKDDFL